MCGQRESCRLGIQGLRSSCKMTLGSQQHLSDLLIEVKLDGCQGDEDPRKE